jgi:DNA polymerase IV
MQHYQLNIPNNPNNPHDPHDPHSPNNQSHQINQYSPVAPGAPTASSILAAQTAPAASGEPVDQPGPRSAAHALEAARAVERAHLRQSVMHVRIRHFYATLEEMFDPSLRGTPFVVGTGTGRPDEPGRIIDASASAMRLGVSPGMPLRRAHSIAHRVRFLPASYARYQPVLQQLRERYRAYSRIIETIPMADAFIDLRGCELPFDSPVALAERLCAEIAEMGLSAMIGVANGKAIAELAALLSRKDGRQGVLYIPPGREASFVQTLPLSLLLQVRTAGAGIPGAPPDYIGLEGRDNHASRPPELEGKSDQVDSVAVAEMVAHLRDFGITTFAQVATLGNDGLRRRLGLLGGWLHSLANGLDISLVVPDAPPLSQNARVRFQHPAEAEETCIAIRRLADYLSERLTDQRLKGRAITLMLWPSLYANRETRKLAIADDSEEIAVAATEEAIVAQMTLPRHADDADLLAYQLLTIFTQHHRPGTRYTQVQVRVGDIISGLPTFSGYYPALSRARGRPTRKL